MGKVRNTQSKIRRRSEVACFVEEAKAMGKDVVFTNGCFDILHIGHIRYLQAARALGDVLIVGVNTDDSVRRLKGPDRPFISEFERAEIVAALECVDCVTLFGEDTPVELILAIKPDIHSKGGDYKPEDLREADAMRSIGGRVEVITYTVTDTQGKSTTNLIERISGS
ncbi:MAG: D-glycero-beta-D-manno-heptose 1-phosphate adenylyltransferase [Armatimonadetes bacterium]|nr:D-glycero-beta-D-manno-heptose 1-phosphate adenylyltransferase [Armatimonadota bacterium]